MKRVLGIVLAASLTIGATATHAATWTAYTFGPSDSLANVRGLKQILGAIEQATDGDVTFRLHLAGSLPIKSTDITQAVGDGTVQFADDGFFQGNVPVAGLLRLPMLLQHREDFRKAVEVMEPYIKAGFEKQDVVVLGHFVFPFQVAFSKPELQGLADFDGLKMRVSSPEQAEFVERLNGIPVTMGGPEVPPGLQRGVIDGVFTASAGGGRIWGDMLDYNYRIPVNYFDGVYIVNREAFESLSEENQKAVRDAVERMAPKTTDLIASEEQEITDKLEAEGMTITQASAEDIRKATEMMMPYWEEWAEERGPTAQEALAKVREAIGR